MSLKWAWSSKVLQQEGGGIQEKFSSAFLWERHLDSSSEYWRLLHSKSLQYSDRVTQSGSFEVNLVFHSTHILTNIYTCNMRPEQALAYRCSIFCYFERNTDAFYSAAGEGVGENFKTEFYLFSLCYFSSKNKLCQNNSVYFSLQFPLHVLLLFKATTKMFPLRFFFNC